MGKVELRCIYPYANVIPHFTIEPAEIMAKAPRTKGNGVTRAAPEEAKGYVHADKDMAARPEVGAAPRFKARKPPTTHRYDSSLSPALDWDTNPAREVAGVQEQT